MEVQPNNEIAQNNIAVALIRVGRLDEAIVHFEKILEINPNNADAQNRLAWVLATCPEASVRDGARALELAQRAEGLAGGNPMNLVTPAAAQAESGRFSEALATARKALDGIASLPNPNPALLNAVRAQIGLYEGGSPFRDASLKNDPGPAKP